MSVTFNCASHYRVYLLTPSKNFTKTTSGKNISTAAKHFTKTKNISTAACKTKMEVCPTVYSDQKILLRAPLMHHILKLLRPQHSYHSVSSDLLVLLSLSTLPSTLYIHNHYPCYHKQLGTTFFEETSSTFYNITTTPATTNWSVPALPYY